MTMLRDADKTYKTSGTKTLFDTSMMKYWNRSLKLNLLPGNKVVLGVDIQRIVSQ